jgi:hypothetical protein
MKSDVIVSLIKEIVKNEVKQQVKEEIVKLIKSGAVTINQKQNQSVSSLKEVTKQKPIVRKEVKELTKDPLLNEILSQTTPFTAAHRAEGGGSPVGSILDSIQPNMGVEGDWETMDYRTTNIPTEQINETGDVGIDAITKALSRDYRELVKRF